MFWIQNSSTGLWPNWRKVGGRLRLKVCATAFHRECMAPITTLTDKNTQNDGKLEIHVPQPSIEERPAVAFSQFSSPSKTTLSRRHFQKPMNTHLSRLDLKISAHSQLVRKHLRPSTTSYTMTPHRCLYIFRPLRIRRLLLFLGHTQYWTSWANKPSYKSGL